MKPLRIAHYTLTNAFGAGRIASLEGLRAGRSALRPIDLDEVTPRTWIGRVDGVEEAALPSALAGYDCRNNRLALLALEQDGFIDSMRRAISRHGATRIGVFLGTSTSGIERTERAYAAHPDGRPLPTGLHDHALTHNMAATGRFLRELLCLRGPMHVISTACSSSAKVFSAARRHIEAGLCDAALVGGVDSLCLTTLYGFNALELLATDPCRPWDRDRAGISIGEGAGFAFIEPAGPEAEGIGLLGHGESSDAYHMSTPHPEGLWAARAMQDALERSDLSASDIGYVNLHATGTRANDQAEDRAMTAVFDGKACCSGTKGGTGHTLGAAGVIEALFACMTIEHGFVPGMPTFGQPDPGLYTPVVVSAREHRVDYAMTNSFGFGGSNCSLVFGRMTA